MANNTNTWWESYREAVKITNSFRELVELLDNREDVARSIIDLEKNKEPGQTELWYLEKLIEELKQDNFVNTLY